MGTKDTYRVGRYARLSREDGDKLESDSIVNQQRVIEDYCAAHAGLVIVEDYADDGFTGTNFNRPAFRRMLDDIEKNKIDCIVVKDLSRFGRDYIDMGYYLERYLPSRNIRFIAINDNVDSLNGPYDMLLPLKNVFNTQYAKDISGKVRSAFRVKQQRGEFVGAFASYGYQKDPENHNRLMVDPVAARVVLRVFQMAAQGIGQVRIAKTLNEEKIPCPSEYKKLMGMKYCNNHRLETTRYWTYATIHRMLTNEMYVGAMVQNRSVRPTMHGKAKALDKKDWVVVDNTHEAIISRELWDTVQAQAAKNGREIDFQGNVGLFAGFLFCGDCGRAMVKTIWGKKTTYSCGSYRRYGATVCSSHSTPMETLEAIILADLNRIIAEVKDLRQVAESCREESPLQARRASEQQRLTAALTRVQHLKKGAYEDYKEKLLSRDEYLRYKEDYDRQEASLQGQLAQLAQQEDPQELLQEPWVDQLLRLGCLTTLDRATLAQTVKEIRVFEDKHIEITYLFSDALRMLLEKPGEEEGQAAREENCTP